jgi:exonuclease SbcD
VDLVIFAGDAYKNRTPAPTFQREWGKRMMRLSKAGIPTLLLIGNHDVSPATGRALSIQEYDTLEVPHIRVISRPCLLTPDDLEGLKLQVIALPWINRQTVAAGILNTEAEPGKDPLEHLQETFTQMVQQWLQEVDPTLPVMLTAHASVEGATYGGERLVMLGQDFTLPGSLVRDHRIDYTALGHIHKHQNLNPGNHPPVIYPGSIERVDFGEAADKKYFVIATISRGKTEVDWRELKDVRPFYDRRVVVDKPEDITNQLMAHLPPREKLTGAIARLTVEYPRDWEAMLDEASIREYAKDTFEFHFLRRPSSEDRVRLDSSLPISSLSPVELTQKYWESVQTPPEESEILQQLAKEVISETGAGGILTEGDPES